MRSKTLSLFGRRKGGAILAAFVAIVGLSGCSAGPDSIDARQSREQIQRRESYLQLEHATPPAQAPDRTSSGGGGGGGGH